MQPDLDTRELQGWQIILENGRVRKFDGFVIGFAAQNSSFP
jgi:hypothetical protein